MCAHRGTHNDARSNPTRLAAEGGFVYITYFMKERTEISWYLVCGWIQPHSQRAVTITSSFYYASDVLLLLPYYQISRRAEALFSNKFPEEAVEDYSQQVSDANE
jgi:hypothetical protein